MSVQKKTCPECGRLIAAGRNYTFHTKDKSRVACAGSGKPVPLGWPPPFPGMEIPDFLLTVRGDFPPDGSKD